MPLDFKPEIEATPSFTVNPCVAGSFMPPIYTKSSSIDIPHF